ncbi:MAG: DUF3365 domain-containing protein [Thermoguttaceae bacterium]
MTSIRTKFFLIVGLFTLTFSGTVLYRIWSSTRTEMEALLAREGELALEFDLAIRQYVRERIRPSLESQMGRDEFVLEAMSSSFIARNVFDTVRKKFPDHIIKFSSDTPRNPTNLAGPEELRMIQFFRDNTTLDRWQGKLTLDGKEYWAHISPMRMEESCRRCHGRPEDAPAPLVARYGSKVGFHRSLGDVIGLDMVAIPMDRVHAALASESTAQLTIVAISLVVLFVAIVLAFQGIVGRRLTALTNHFRRAAEQAESVPVAAVAVDGRDEISVLARSYNVLAARLRAFHASLEQRVAERTSELQAEIVERRRAEETLQKEQQALRQLLTTYEGHRRLVAYELHDGVTQAMIGALMTLEGTLQHLPAQTPEAAADGFQTVRHLLRQSIDETRRMISGLRPAVLDELGIVPAIESLILENQLPAGPEIEFVREVQFDRLAAPLETALFRIVQEGITNARRHSQSARLRVGLFQQGERIKVEVEDWGIGFDPAQVGSGCFGLEGIRKRAEMFGGLVTIDSAPGKGTRIAVDLPLVERASDDSA